MSRNTIKLFSLLVAVMMMVSVIAGCGTSTNKTTEEKTVQSTAQQTSTAVEEQGYVPEKELELTIWDTQGTDVAAVEKPKEDNPGEWLANKTKVSIKEFYGNSGQQWEPKLTTLVASGNLPSLVLTEAGQGPAHHAKLHEGDLNWELTPEIIQKYAPDVWKFVPQYIWDSIKIDGKIYGIPFGFPVDKEIEPTLSDDFVDAFSVLKDKATSSSNQLLIRDDILKKLIPSALNYEEAMALIKGKNALIGDSMVLPIKSTDEYIKFMYDIKALGLKVGNKPVYAMGYSGGDNWTALSVLGSEMCGFKGYFYTGWLDISQKKMGFGYLNPAFKEAAWLQTKMIIDKVIDPESLVHNVEKYMEKVMNGQYAIIWNGTAGDVNPNMEKAGKSYRYVPFFTQVPQKAEFQPYKEGPPSFNQTLSILKTVKENEVSQVLNWINTMFTDEWEEIKYWGTKEAGLYEDLSDGTRKFKDEKMHKFLVEQDMTAMDWKDAKGLNFNNIPLSGGTPGFWGGVVKWQMSGASKYGPAYYNKIIKFGEVAMNRFPASSPWTKGLIPVPNVQSWSAEYANINEVKMLWSTRATWDDPFKIAFTAKNEEDFNKKWDGAVANFRKTVDVDKMLDEQTKIVLPLLEKRTAQAK